MKVSRTASEALKRVGLAGANNYQRVYKLAKLKGIDRFKTTKQKIEERHTFLRNSGIDLTEKGSLTKASKKLNISSQALGRWLNKHPIN